MLKNLDPLLGGNLLKLLDEMGHGDVLALVDRNFPSHRYGKPVVRLDGVGIEAVASAVLSVFSLDEFVDSPVERMQIDDRPDEVTDVAAAFSRICTAAEGRDVLVAGIERQEFYARAASASFFIQTGETVGYSCFLLRKGVV
jgi:L-fucose mutarotase